MSESLHGHESSADDRPSAPPAPAPPPPPPAPIATTAPPPHQGTQPTGGARPLDAGVLSIAAVTVLLLVGLVIWGGGETASNGRVAASPASPATPEGGASGGGSGGLTSSPQAAGVDPAFDAAALQIIGSPTAPTDPRTLGAWKVASDLDAALTELRTSFPVPGWELRKSLGTSTENGVVTEDTWLVKPVGVEMTYVTRTLTFRVDPSDPASTIVEYRASE